MSPTSWALISPAGTPSSVAIARHCGPSVSSAITQPPRFLLQSFLGSDGNRTGLCCFILTHFLHTNRRPLRLKMLYATLLDCMNVEPALCLTPRRSADASRPRLIATPPTTDPSSPSETSVHASDA